VYTHQVNSNGGSSAIIMFDLLYHDQTYVLSLECYTLVVVLQT